MDPQALPKGGQRGGVQRTLPVGFGGSTGRVSREQSNRNGVALAPKAAGTLSVSWNVSVVPIWKSAGKRYVPRGRLWNIVLVLIIRPRMGPPLARGFACCALVRQHAIQHRHSAGMRVGHGGLDALPIASWARTRGRTAALAAGFRADRQGLSAPCCTREEFSPSIRPRTQELGVRAGCHDMLGGCLSVSYI